MKANQNSLGDNHYRFHTTRWSTVLRSGRSQGPGFQVALTELYRIWYPRYAHRGHVPKEAQDFTQAIGRTVSGPADLDAGIHELCEALMAAEGWLIP